MAFENTKKRMGLILFVPLKCERYLMTNEMDEVSKRTEESYEELIRYLKKAGKFFGIGGGNQQVENHMAEIGIEPEDKPLMKEYEDLIISNLGCLYNGQMPQDTIKEMIEAVNHGRVTDKVLRLAGSKTNISQPMLKLLGGMAFLNYPLSDKLKNVVRICLSANMDGMLDTMRGVSMGLPMDILINGGDYDRIFEIDSENYLKWTAVKGHKSILAEQLKNNRES